MKLKIFTADTMAKAMEMVRDSLGPDAIIVSTYEGKRGRGVEIRAVVDSPPPPVPKKRNSTEIGSFPVLTKSAADTNRDAPPTRRTLASLRGENLQHLKRALTFHGFSRNLGKAILESCDARDSEDIADSMASFLELRLKMSPLHQFATKPVILVGPPGAGKTAITAKLAARAVLFGQKPLLATTDTLRSGAVEQLASIARLMQLDVHEVDTPNDLSDLVSRARDEGTVALIDTPATNHFKQSEMSDLQRFINAIDAIPTLVLPAGGLWGDDLDTVRAFNTLGVNDLIVTRLDATRRIGGVLSAADALDLNLVACSDSPYIAQGLWPASAEMLATRILNIG